MVSGNALLALWNGVDPARDGEYNLWHTREHVPQRMSVPGMLRAFRYVDGEGPLPQYLTLYDLADPDVLKSAPYRYLLENPTVWSLSMRPSFGGFLRIACGKLARGGCGTGGAVLATTLRLPGGLDLPDAQAIIEKALAISAVTGADLSLADPESPDVPFKIGGEMPDYPRDAVLVLEGYDRAALVAAEGVADLFAASSLITDDLVWTSYSLAYVFGHEDLARAITTPQQAV